MGPAGQRRVRAARRPAPPADGRVEKVVRGSRRPQACGRPREPGGPDRHGGAARLRPLPGGGSRGGVPPDSARAERPDPARARQYDQVDLHDLAHAQYRARVPKPAGDRALDHDGPDSHHPVLGRVRRALRGAHRPRLRPAGGRAQDDDGDGRPWRVRPGPRGRDPVARRAGRPGPAVPRDGGAAPARPRGDHPGREARLARPDVGGRRPRAPESPGEHPGGDPARAPRR